MCGIAGWIDWQRDLSGERPAVERMAAVLDHRGPDGEGAWSSPRAALAHRRLSVIDPAGGAQPMLCERDGNTLVVTYNGEIYNFPELKRELEGRGHRFASRCDTEVLLHAYREWGEAFVERLNGIFAFGLWDEGAERLLLARDHLGVKPLYYVPRGASVVFASEVKALLEHPWVAPEVDADGLAELIAPCPLRTPGFSIYRGVEEVRPGEMLVVDRQSIRAVRYWRLRSVPHGDDLETTVERVRELLADTVERQLLADVPVVSLLSGGLDSSGVTALAARVFERRGSELHTYSVEHPGSDGHFRADPLQPSLDGPWACRVSEHLGTRHHSITVDADALLEHLLLPTHARDAPGIGQLDTSLYLLCKAIGEDAKVALSGEAADEMFGGYPWFHRAEAVSQPTFPWAALVSEGGADYQRLLMSPEVLDRVRPEAYVRRRYEEAIAEVPRLEGEPPAAAKMREIFYLNLTHWLSMLLDRKDRMSMAAGVEVRVPFCDYRLVEYLWNVPWEMQSVDGVEKGLLRRALAGVLPDEFRHRSKSAFPLSRDPRYLEKLRLYGLAILDDPDSRVLELLNVPVVRAVAAGEVAAVPDRYALNLLERVIQLEGWMRSYEIEIC